MRTHRGVATGVLVGLLLVGAGCNSKRGAADTGESGSGGGHTSVATATIGAPAEGATDVATTAAITISVTGQPTTDAAVTVTDAEGNAVAGDLDAVRGVWQPKSVLDWGTTYTATVTPAGGTAAVSHFTTVRRPNQTAAVTSFIGDGDVVGVAMPVIIRFGHPVADGSRAELERRMTVTSTPEQVGSWHWVSETEVHYRPQEFWKPKTKISYRLATQGVPMGGGWFAGNSLTVALRVRDHAITMVTDSRTHRMTVSSDDTVLRVLKVSLGMPKRPSSSGTMVVMQKLAHTRFDTRKAAAKMDRYNAKIDYAQQLTIDGQYLHSAAWSVNQQGYTNVSHGCTNLAPVDAKWLFDLTNVGDPVIVRHTEVDNTRGNGWTDWDLSWKQYQAGSAL